MKGKKNPLEYGPYAPLSRRGQMKCFKKAKLSLGSASLCINKWNKFVTNWEIAWWSLQHANKAIPSKDEKELEPSFRQSLKTHQHMDGKWKGKAATESISHVFNIKLKWLRPGLLTVNSKAILRFELEASVNP